MGYSHRTETPPAPAAIPAAPKAPPAVADLITYAVRVGYAASMCEQIETRGASPECEGWHELTLEIRSASAALMDAAESVQRLEHTGHATPALLEGIPPALLLRIIAGGLQAEAESLLDLIDCINAPDVEGGCAP